MKIIRRGMIGCGKVTEVKSGQAFSKAEGSQRTSRVLDQLLKEREASYE